MTLQFLFSLQRTITALVALSPGVDVVVVPGAFVLQNPPGQLAYRQELFGAQVRLLGTRLVSLLRRDSPYDDRELEKKVF